jgi:hypothetical protein
VAPVVDRSWRGGAWVPPCRASDSGATRRVRFWPARPISSLSRSHLPARIPACHRRPAIAPMPLPSRNPAPSQSGDPLSLSLSLALSISLRSCGAHGGIGRDLGGLPRRRRRPAVQHRRVDVPALWSEVDCQVKLCVLHLLICYLICWLTRVRKFGRP